MRLSLTKKDWADWLEKIACGTTLVEICDRRGLTFGSVRNWINRHPEMKTEYEEAERAYADYHFSQCIPIADEAEDTNKAKLMIDTRLKVVAKLNKDKYGDQGGLTMNLGANSLVAILSSLPRSEMPAIESRAEKD